MEFSAHHREAVAKVVRERQIAIDDLTEKQVVEVFLQAIASGDIIRQVRQGGDAQGVIYIPFAEQQRLESEIAELKQRHDLITSMLSRFLVAHRDIHRNWIESFVEVNAVTADFNYHPLYPFIAPVRFTKE